MSVIYVCINGFGKTGVNTGKMLVDLLLLDNITAISRIYRSRIRWGKKG